VIIIIKKKNRSRKEYKDYVLISNVYAIKK
jgi:hypothetical protein